MSHFVKDLSYHVYFNYRLCVATLKLLQFGTEDEALFAMFDGGHNNDVPKRLLRVIPEILKEELQHRRTGDKYMKYTMLSAHRSVIFTVILTEITCRYEYM